MNTQKLAAALTNIADALYEASEALTEQPAGRALPAGVASGAVHPPDTAPDDLPPLPPLMEEQYADELAYENLPTPLPRSVSQADKVLGRCSVHDKPWRAVPGGVSKRTGRPYKAFWSCPDRDCDKRPAKAWVDSHDPEKAAVAS